VKNVDCQQKIHPPRLDRTHCLHLFSQFAKVCHFCKLFAKVGQDTLFAKELQSLQTGLQFFQNCQDCNIGYRNHTNIFRFGQFPETKLVKFKTDWTLTSGKVVSHLGQSVSRQTFNFFVLDQVPQFLSRQSLLDAMDS